MTSAEDAAARFRKRSEELRADASKVADPKLRAMLLKLAKSCAEMAAQLIRTAEKR
jgi:hypothetical protein